MRTGVSKKGLHLGPILGHNLLPLADVAEVLRRKIAGIDPDPVRVRRVRCALSASDEATRVGANVPVNPRHRRHKRAGPAVQSNAVRLIAIAPDMFSSLMRKSSSTCTR